MQKTQAKLGHNPGLKPLLILENPFFSFPVRITELV
jgi:hypothetical protein